MKYFEEQLFEGLNYQNHVLEVGDYEGCQFLNCNFSEANISNIRFIECEFIDCNLSNAIMANTSFQNVRLKECKMLGLQFDKCEPFGLSFEFLNCTLNHSSFYQTNIRETLFKNCQLHGVDFTESDLLDSTLENCDLSRAVFENSNLEKVNLKTSYNYSIDPENNKIKKASFSKDGISGLLDKYDIEIEN